MDFKADEQRVILSKSLALVRKSAYRLKQIDNSNFPTDTSDAARNLLLSCVETLGNPSHVGAMSPPVLYNRLHGIFRLIDVVELSSTDRISWPLVSYCDAIWHSLFGDEGPKIFYSLTPDHNYKITRFTQLALNHLRDLLATNVVDGLAKNGDLYCLELASAEDDNLPLYANIGHEFGHVVFDVKKIELHGALSSSLRGLLPELHKELQDADQASAPRRFRRLLNAIVGIAKELFCDQVGFLLMGPAFFLSLYEIAWGQDSKTTFSIKLSPNDNTIKSYPSMHFRLHCIKKLANIDAFCADATKAFQVEGVGHLIPLIGLLSSVPTDHPNDIVRVRPNTDPDWEAIQIALSAKLAPLKICLEHFLSDCQSRLKVWYSHLAKPCVEPSDIAALLHRLDEDILPNVVPDHTLLGSRATFAAILNASALYRLKVLMDGTIDKQDELASRINLVERLTSKSFEVSFMHKQYMTWKDAPTNMGVLNAAEIRRHMEESDYSEKLLVTPLLSEKQIGPASVDVRLGSSIIIPKKAYVEQQDVTDPQIVRQVEQRRYDRKRLKYQSRFMLHPNQLILGVTYEYISLPFNICCQIVSRSSWGRLGLVVATAAMVQPGYKGCLTLELVNLSESPISLYPGLPIGQLIFHEVSTHGEKTFYKGRYDCPTEAELPKFFVNEADKEMEFWGESDLSLT